MSEMIYGEATVTTEGSYEDYGGVSVYSVDPPSEAIIGSGGRGTVTTSNQIRWWIARDASEKIIGGIQGEDWYDVVEGYDLDTGEIKIVYGPFYQKDREDMLNEAQNTGALNSYFDDWNISAEDKLWYIMRLENTGCVTLGGIIS